MYVSLWKIAAFIKRDFLVESSYKAAFVLQMVSTVLPLFSFYFIGKLVDSDEDSSLHQYGGDYFEFVLIGVGLASYLLSTLRTFGNIVRRAQTSGVLEVTLSTRTSPQSIILYSSCYTVLAALVQLLFLFAVGWIVFRVDYSRADALSVLVTLLLSMASSVALGILSATAIVMLKKGDPIEFVTVAATSVLAGTYFPVDLLPDSLEAVSQILPITHALEAMRLAMFKGQNIVELWYPLCILAVITAVLLPSSLYSFAWAVERGRRDGSLGRY